MLLCVPRIVIRIPYTVTQQTHAYGLLYHLISQQCKEIVILQINFIYFKCIYF